MRKHTHAADTERYTQRERERERGRGRGREEREIAQKARGDLEGQKNAARECSLSSSFGLVSLQTDRTLDWSVTVR